MLKKEEGAAFNRRITGGKAWLGRRVILSVAVFALAGSLFLLPSCSSGQSVPSASETPAPANTAPEREFPAFAYNSAEVLLAYQTAVQIPEVLLLIPCYCGCGEAHDHKNLKDCFFKADGSLNDHAAFCEICDMEVADVAKWQAEGYSLEQIRGFIDVKYRDWGEPTDTEPIAQPEVSPAPQPPTDGFSEGPRISFAVDSVDLGGVPMEIAINYAFRFKNVGNAPLNIIDVRAKVLAGC